MASRLLIKLPSNLVRRCRAFATDVVNSYASGNNNNSLAVSTHGAEKNIDLWAESKMAECIFAIEFNLSPLDDLNWQLRPDGDYDIIVGEHRVDVKCGQMHDRYLIWPIGKNHLFKQKQFDILAFTKVDLTFAAGHTVGWVSKSRFLRERWIADEDHKLDVGTRYMEEANLDSLDKFPDKLGPVDHFTHYCHCGKWGAFGHGVSMLKGEPGTWYCMEHKPQ